MKYIYAFGVMLQFLTRFPLPLTLPCDEDTFKRGMWSFVPVGLVLGLFLVVSYAVLNLVYLDLWIQAVVLMWLHVGFTGGLHLDGVADSADGLLSNRPPERMLEIMKDSRIGSNGVLALMASLSLKVVGIRLILDLPQPEVFLLLMPAMGRYAVVFAATIGKTPREKGMGNLFIGQGNFWVVCFNALLIAAFSHLYGGILVPLLVATAFTTLLVYRITKLIGGITGDVLGLTIELNEVLFLFAVTIPYYYF